jgi:ABC-type multidrug transport system fused ATPase/permease subunit
MISRYYFGVPKIFHKRRYLVEQVLAFIHEFTHINVATMANILPIIRKLALAVALLFSLITLSLAAHFTSTTEEVISGYYYFAVLAIATSVLTLVSLPVLLIVDMIRTGAFTSMVVVEVGWLSILWVLWLATGADAADVSSKIFISGCDYKNRLAILRTPCHEAAAITAFSFLTWLVLLGYVILLLTFSIIGSNKGHRVWTSSVKETDFLAAPAGAQDGGYPTTFAPQMTHQNEYPPAQQSYPQSPAPTGYSSPQPTYGTPQPQGYGGQAYPQV